MPMLIPADGFKPGDVDFKPRTSAPAGWLKCNGATVNRTTYAALFAVIGTTFGAGDGATTFALPDLRGEFVRGLDDGRGVDTGRGMGSAQAGSTGPHDHYTRAGAGVVSDNYGGSGADYGTNSSNLAVSTDGTTATTGPGIGAETRPRNVAMLACIKY